MPNSRENLKALKTLGRPVAVMIEIVVLVAVALVSMVVAVTIANHRLRQQNSSLRLHVLRSENRGSEIDE